MAARWGHDKRSFKSTQEEHEDSTRKKGKVRDTVKRGKKGKYAKGKVKPDPHEKSADPEGLPSRPHGKKGKYAKGKVKSDPHVKSEEPEGLPSTTHGDFPADSAPSLSKTTAVPINPEPLVKDPLAFSPPFIAKYFKPDKIPYDWQSHLFHEPQRSAMKPTTDQLPKAPSELPVTSPNVPSGTAPIELPNLLESAVTQSKTQSGSSNVTSTMSSAQPKLTDPSDPSKASLILLKHASTTHSASVEDVTSAMPNEPTPAEFPKVTGVSTLPSVTLKGSTELPPIPPKGAGVNLPAHLSSLKSKRTRLSESPTKLPPIKPTEKPIKKSPTWPPLMDETWSPPITPEYYYVTNPKVSCQMPLMSCRIMSLREWRRRRFQTLKDLQLESQISPQGSPEEARREIVKPVNIAEEIQK